ncbi:Zn(II)2Cys6 transcription factor [Aspergillus mulundensis]|uniref:Putative Zn(II)2Cys6 transcription factor n=1 Tax=Aspergillus mulundensis TaxID=1810919 RepID=A0A3D8Q7P7_9EURO|nr:putative Zn(II)2Cys6 transcription factor [Aspergillus mulundensis]RDW57855.1 putative Zn(II)2Cys6 transcription factor [Aspergillus mulundensis]
MPLRRTHRKSRHGCKACKQRRVKCDEKRPTCSNCTTRQEECEYVTDASYIWAADEPPAPRRTRSRRIAPSITTTTTTTTQGSTPETPFRLLDRPFSHETASLTPPLDMTQLRLLVNWQTETCQFFSRDAETRIVWQVSLVDEALKTPPLMHGILAVSALHLALLDLQCGQEQAFWLGLATAHKGEALQALREGLNSVAADNARSMMGLSALVVAYAFGAALTGSGADDSGDRPSLDSLNNIFVLCRGVQQVTNSAYAVLRQSNFAPLFNPGDQSVAIPDHVRESLDHLEHLNTECLQAGEHDHDSATYTRVIEALRSLSGHAFTQPNSMTLAAGWAIRVSSEYLGYLQANHPFALVVHAHYCAFLHLARGNCFLRSWGRAVLEDILCLLDDEWKPHIEWPVTEVFGDGHLQSSQSPVFSINT